jgi:hypothetical protein
MSDRVTFLEQKNKELKLELKKKNERLSELEITVKVLRKLNGESEQHGRRA